MFDENALARRAQSRVGTMLAGKYRLDAVLGIGGMAVVYAATHRNQAEFAIKVLHPELSFHEDLRTRFLREGYTANSVKHPGAVHVVDDAIAEDGAAFLVMELLRGTVVEDLRENHGGRLPLPIVLAIADQLLQVLEAAHARGIVHRDIKPTNLFVTNDGTLKVLDFGIARAREAFNSGAASGKSTGTGMVLGTPAFMSPEQAIAKAKQIDAQTDVWAAAATFFTLVSGQLVHPGESATELLVMAATSPARPLNSVAPHVVPAVAHVVDRGLAFEKTARWPTAEAMRLALAETYRATVGELPTRATLESFAASTPRPAAGGTMAVFASAPPFPPLTPVFSPTAVTPASIPPGGSAPWPPPSVQRAPTPFQSNAIPKQSAAPWVAVAAVITLLLAVGAVVGLRSLIARREPASAVASVGASAAQVPAPSAPAPQPVVTLPLLPTPEPSVETASAPPLHVDASEAAALPPARLQPAIQQPVNARVGPVPPASRAAVPASRAAAAPKCDPPFTIDGAGHRVPKPECL